jgi:hypothetical protein
VSSLVRGPERSKKIAAAHVPEITIRFTHSVESGKFPMRLPQTKLGCFAARGGFGAFRSLQMLETGRLLMVLCAPYWAKCRYYAGNRRLSVAVGFRDATKRMSTQVRD